MGASDKDEKQMRETSKEKPSVPPTDDHQSDKEVSVDGEAAADSDGLSPEQEDALNKIMAEIEGNDEAPTETAGSVAEAEEEDETAQPPSDNSAPNASDDAVDSEEGLSPEQEDALNKIMAEIEGNDEDTAEGPKNDPAANAAAKGGTEAKALPSDAPDTSADEVDSEEALSPEQEDALNKILAEIEGSEEVDAKSLEAEAEVGEVSKADEAVDGADAAEDPPSVRSAAAEDADSEPGLSSEQEDALNKIMAEIEGQSGSPQETPAPSESAEMTTPDGAQTHTAGAEETPETEATATSDAGESPRPDESASNAALPSTEDLLSQIQAAAQGSEEELTVTTDASEDQISPQEPAAPRVDESQQATAPQEANASPEVVPSSDSPPPPLAEIKDPAPNKKGMAAKPKRSISKKIVKTVVWTGLAAAVVAMMATGTYFWLSRGGAAPTAASPPALAQDNRESAPAAPPLAEEALGEALLSDQVLSDEDLSGEALTGEALTGEALSKGDLASRPEALTAPSNAPTVSPESERLEALSERIRTHRTDMLAKAREIEDLSTYYAGGIEKLTQELVARIKERQITDFKSAQKDTAIAMGLDTIQRRAGYIEKLALPRRQILAATEELRYLARKADILGMIAAKSSGLNLDPFSKQVDEVLERLSNGVSELSLEENTATGPALKEIWENVWSVHMKAPKNEPPEILAMRRNSEIWKEICDGDFTRVGELSALSGEGAACLAAWEGKDLFLNNLEQLSPEAAKGLTGWNGEWLVLNGLKSLSPETARHLASWKGKRLSLNGLSDLSPAATRALAKWQGSQIEMIGLRRLAAWDNPQVTLYVRSEVRDNLIP